MWECPAARMKARKRIVCRCQTASLALLVDMGPGAKDAWSSQVNPGPAAVRHGDEAAQLRMQIENMTSHGFRSSFRDWAGECTNFPREICEAALAHAVGNAVELAYRRADALEKRRALMEAWANYCEPQNGNVVPLSRPA